MDIYNVLKFKLQIHMPQAKYVEILVWTYVFKFTDHARQTNMFLLNNNNNYWTIWLNPVYESIY